MSNSVNSSTGSHDNINKLMRVSLRTKETEDKYMEDKKTFPSDYCPFCDDWEIEIKEIKEFTHWRIMRNRYPYDAIFSISDLLVCKRHVSDAEGLMYEEREELDMIKQNILSGGDYDMWAENAKPRRTVPVHLHMHLLKY